MNPGYAIAILAAILYGTADFLGGYASRKVSAFTVTFASASAGLLTLLVAMPFIRGTPDRADYIWGAAGGTCGGLGVALLYRAFAMGPVSVAAPTISLMALVIPVAVGLALGERPSRLAIGGMMLAVAAFPLLSRTGAPEPGRPRESVFPVSIASGILVGFFLVLIGRVSQDAGLGPLVLARITTVVLFGTILVLRHVPPWPAAAVHATVSSGALDTLANIAYFVSVHLGALAIVATIVSLAPAVSVLLARIVLGERWSPSQRVGLACATAAILCVSMG